jgi:NADPH:quinone reductase-like Zn-dependent oxidoreductase
VGDKVVATWEIFGVGGLGQYHKVNPKKTVKLPEGLTVEEGAALANTASHVLLILNKANIQKSERVLVLGGSGGIGTLLVQMLKGKEASYIAATSTDTALMKELGVDRAMDYTKENWWELKEWKDDQFDCIIDVAEGRSGWKKAPPVLKSGRKGGRFIAGIMQDWHIDGQHIYQIFGLLLPPFGRQMFNMFRWSTPYYRVYLDEPTKETMTEILEKAASKELKTVLDPESPHAFTTEGVRAAWNKHIARKGHGKIVISVD